MPGTTITFTSDLNLWKEGVFERSPKGGRDWSKALYRIGEGDALMRPVCKGGKKKGRIGSA